MRVNFKDYKVGKGEITIIDDVDTEAAPEDSPADTPDDGTIPPPPPPLPKKP